MPTKLFKRVGCKRKAKIKTCLRSARALEEPSNSQCWAETSAWPAKMPSWLAGVPSGSCCRLHYLSSADELFVWAVSARRRPKRYCALRICFEHGWAMQALMAILHPLCQCYLYQRTGSALLSGASFSDSRWGVEAKRARVVESLEAPGG
jgi:hypothetical protein